MAAMTATMTVAAIMVMGMITGIATDDLGALSISR